MLVVSGEIAQCAVPGVGLSAEGRSDLGKKYSRRDGTLWYYRAIADALREADGPAPIVEELLRVVAEIEALSVSEKA